MVMYALLKAGADAPTQLANWASWLAVTSAAANWQEERRAGQSGAHLIKTVYSKTDECQDHASVLWAILVLSPVGRPVFANVIFYKWANSRSKMAATERRKSNQGAGQWLDCQKLVLIVVVLTQYFIFIKS